MKYCFLKYVLFLLFSAFYFGLSAQIELDVENSELIVEKIENLYESNEEEYDLTDILDKIEDLKQNPVAINSSDIKEIGRLFFLDDRKVYNIAVYTTTFGVIMSTNELYAIDGLNEDIINLMLPFITLDVEVAKKKTTFKQIFKYGKHQIITRYQRTLQEQHGYMNDSIAGSYKYAGDPNKYYLRYRFKYSDNISFGLTAEKDAGEEFFKGSNKKGFDFYSAHLYLKNFGFLEQLAIGDYHLTFGHGLTMWSAMAFGKSSEGVGVKRKESGITPNTSVNEADFFRGTAATFRIGKRHYITGFYSSLERDGTFATSNEGTISSISSLTNTGMHRTANEISKRNVAHLSTSGARYQWTGSTLKIGITGFGTFLDVPMIKDSTLNNLYAFNGKSLMNAGIDFSWFYKKFEFFGECSYGSLFNGWAALLGTNIQLSSRIEISLVARNYQKDYINFYSNAFGENSGNNNEQGIYGGFNAVIMPKVTLSGYVDIMRFPYFKYNIFAPTSGNDFLVQANYSPITSIVAYLRYNYRYRQTNYSDEISKRIIDTEKHSVRLHASFSITKNITMKSRIEYVMNKKIEETNGFVMYAELKYKTLNDRFKSSLCYAKFDTDTYDNRIYVYESDMLYQFSVPAYYSQGDRFYLLLQYKVNNNISCWFRISNTYFSNQNAIGSNGDAIYGNNKTEIKAQVSYKF